MLAIALRLELRLSPPSAASTERISVSQVSKSSGSYSYSVSHGIRILTITYDLTIQSVKIIFWWSSIIISHYSLLEVVGIGPFAGKEICFSGVCPSYNNSFGWKISKATRKIKYRHSIPLTSASRDPRTDSSFCCLIDPNKLILLYETGSDTAIFNVKICRLRRQHHGDWCHTYEK